MRYRWLKGLLFVLVFAGLMLPPLASAHFKLNLNVRIVHVEHQADGLNVYLRLPMPYLVAHLLGETVDEGLPEPAPFTFNRMEQGVLVHFVDPGQLEEFPQGLGDLARAGHALRVDGALLAIDVEEVRVYPIGLQPRFTTLDEARLSFEQDQRTDVFAQGVYVGDATVDVQLRYRGGGGSIDSYSLSSTLDPGLPEQDQTANLLLDYRPGSTRVFRVRGLMHDPIQVSRSAFDAWKTFILEGIKHILEGLDHVLFVICLVLGAMRLKPLLWRVTGFTVGHSITLSLGFFGFVPSAVWFVPAVETGIALSIIYVAMVAIWPDIRGTQRAERGEWSVVGVTGLIGMLHGLGFSFVLQKILQVTSPDIWQSLLAFNIGVEIGQLLIVLGSLSVFLLFGKLGPRVSLIGRYLVALGCAGISLVWVIERGTGVIRLF